MKLILILCTLFFSGIAFAQWQDAFSTKINSHLLIGGKKCMGGEVSGTSGRLCKKDRWLINIDRADQGPTFISLLRKVDIITPTTIAFYEILPKDRIAPHHRMLLRKFWVRFDLNGEPKVIKKPRFHSTLKLPISISSDGDSVHAPF